MHFRSLLCPGLITCLHHHFNGRCVWMNKDYSVDLTGTTESALEILDWTCPAASQGIWAYIDNDELRCTAYCCLLSLQSLGFNRRWRLVLHCISCLLSLPSPWILIVLVCPCTTVAWCTQWERGNICILHARGESLSTGMSCAVAWRRWLACLLTNDQVDRPYLAVAASLLKLLLCCWYLHIVKFRCVSIIFGIVIWWRNGCLCTQLFCLFLVFISDRAYIAPFWIHSTHQE